MFNLYVSNTKNNKTYLSTFPGLSLGETRGFLLDMFIRDLKKQEYSCLQSFMPSTSKELEANSLDDIKKTSKQVEAVLYDTMSAQQILTTVWRFSDKTIIVVKS